MANIRPAATVVLLRDGERGLETLLLRRQETLQFAGGMWVFPGGAIDVADYADTPEDHLGAARRAAAREAQEEAGLLVDPSGLVYFSHWTTPEPSKKRYATWFFAARFEGLEEVQVDGGEIERHQWLRPEEAIAAHRRREVDMMPPTFISLSYLLGVRDSSEALTRLADREVVEILPRLARDEHGTLMLYQGDAGYDSGDPAAPGARNRCQRGAEGWDYLCFP
jgi:8-oxo-dGTP pyrophosphatase MutT (NUDIX family)